MSMKKMRIRIARDGRTEIRVEGGEGANCLDFTKAMEQALGTVQTRELTADHVSGSQCRSRCRRPKA